MPIFAIGAALLGGIAVAVSAANAPDQPESKSGSSRAQRNPNVSPQSYVITPISTDGSQPQPMSVVEAVRKFIV